MKHIKTLPEFMTLSEESVETALNAYENENQNIESADLHPSDPIVAEVMRLMKEYTARFDLYCEQEEDALEDVLEDVLSYDPEVPIERMAYNIFLLAVHDVLQEKDDE